MKKQWRGFLAGFLVAVLCLTLGGNTMAAALEKVIHVFTGVTIYIDDVKLEPTDAKGNPVEVFLTNGTTYLPVRAISEALGKVVQWEGKTRSVYIGKHNSESPAVMLQDLDYFTGQKFQTVASDKDNLGQTRTNCIITSSRSNTYKINGQYRLLTGTLYQRYDYRNDYSGGSIEVYGDGKLLYTAEMDRGIEPIDFSVDIEGVLELRVIYNSEGNSMWNYAGTAISNCGLWT